MLMSLGKTKKLVYVVVELLTKDVVKTFKFKEDVEDMDEQLMKVKPFGHHPLPKFLKEQL